MNLTGSLTILLLGSTALGWSVSLAPSTRSVLEWAKRSLTMAAGVEARDNALPPNATDIVVGAAAAAAALGAAANNATVAGNATVAANETVQADNATTITVSKDRPLAVNQTIPGTDYSVQRLRGNFVGIRRPPGELDVEQADVVAAADEMLHQLRAARAFKAYTLVARGGDDSGGGGGLFRKQLSLRLTMGSSSSSPQGGSALDAPRLAELITAGYRAQIQGGWPSLRVWLISNGAWAGMLRVDVR